MLMKEKIQKTEENSENEEKRRHVKRETRWSEKNISEKKRKEIIMLP